MGSLLLKKVLSWWFAFHGAMRLITEVWCDRAWPDSFLAFVCAERPVNGSPASALLSLDALSAFAVCLFAKLRVRIGYSCGASYF